MNIIKDLTDTFELAEFNPYTRLMMQFKLSRGDEMVDFRPWILRRSDQEWHPGYKNGMMIEKRLARIVLTKALEVLDAHDSSQNG